MKMHVAVALVAVGYFAGSWYAEIKAVDAVAQAAAMLNAAEEEDAAREDGCDPGYENDCPCESYPPDDPDYCSTTDAPYWRF